MVGSRVRPNFDLFTGSARYMCFAYNFAKNQNQNRGVRMKEGIARKADSVATSLAGAAVLLFFV